VCLLQPLNHPFKPIIDKNSKILILGTFPSIKSFENFYYGHPKNQFWKILASVYEENIPLTKEEKIDFILRHNLALWDIIKTCKRKNSSDKNLEVLELNDIKKLLFEYPNIKKICFTSKTAQKLFNKEYNIKNFYLPSPSPAYARIRIEDKIKEYKKILKD